MGFKIAFFLMILTCKGFSQTKNEDKLTAGADFYNIYVFRGTSYGTGPAVQPTIKYTSGLLTAGAWGSFDFNGYKEADLWFTISLPKGFSIGMTDYYYPSYDYFDVSSETGSHAFEINAAFSLKNFSLSGNYIINKAGNAGSEGSDVYLEASYSAGFLSLFLGAGNGWHTLNTDSGADKFNLCNAGIGVNKAVKINDSFSVPVTGKIIFNPDARKMFLAVGFTLQ